MAVAMLAGGIPPELGDVLVAVDAVAVTVFFGMLYANEIAAATARLRKWFSPWLILARCRQWFATHKTSN